MRKIVHSNLELCVGCNRCARECPLEMANLTYQDDSGAIKVKIDSDMCIACGACIAVCKHEARYYEDDTQAFFSDLAAGAPISLIAAPSVRTNIPDWKRLFSCLKQLGVRKIYDVSLGADICIWAHLRYIERHSPRSLITQPCAAIVSYCEIHRHELLENLSPVHSPMVCTAIYMREHEGIADKIAAVSPCIAKANEFEAVGAIQYNVTFAKLQDYIKKHGMVLPEEETEFDHYESGLGSLFPTPGGLKENIEFFTGKTLRVDKSEGRAAYRHLEDYRITPKELLPDVFDVLSCAAGCAIGSGCDRNQNVFQIQSVMNSSRQRALRRREPRYYAGLYEKYDSAFDLSRFLRAYEPVHVPLPELSEEDIRNSFALLDKDSFAKQNFNCGACGSESCRAMARKIALGINIPLNCMVKSRDDARAEHGRNIELYRRNTGYIRFMHGIGENILALEEGEHADFVRRAVKALCAIMGGSGAYIWKARRDEGDALYFERLFGWSERKESAAGILRGEKVPNWYRILSGGGHIHKIRPDMTEREKNVFPNLAIGAILVLPVLVKDGLWGFITVDSEEERLFSEEQVSVAVAGGLLIASSIIEKEMTRSLVDAREAALAGTRAKSDFLSRMSHEMRTPMNAIIGMTKIAGSSADVKKLRHCISTINTSSVHLLELINDVLDMSKIESGKFELDASPFNIESALMKICNMISEKTEKRRQTLRITMDGAMPLHCVGDELRLSQVITNLLSNAVKFTPEEGTITLTAREARREGEQSVLRFSVADTGIGMDKAQMARIFSAFEQADGGIAKRFGGTGLGLAISKSIVEKMDGRIWVTSEPGQGATFTFEVTLRRQARQEPAPLPKERAEGLRVLVLDRDEELRGYFLAIMSRLGVRAEAATSEAQALGLVRAAKEEGTPYAVAFVDCGGKGGQGLECAKRLRQAVREAAGGNGKAGGYASVVPMASFLEWNAMEAAATDAGMETFVPKPLFPSILVDAINEVTGLTRSVTRQDRELPDFSQLTILLAEDIEINREIFTTLLEDTRIHVETAENGRLAVEAFQADPRRYDLIVMDIQMPEMDGYEATRRIRSLPLERARSIPILAMTANAFQEDIEQCRRAGMNDHLSKPIDEQALMEKIARYAKPR